LAAKKRKRRKKSNPSYEVAKRLILLAPTFAISFPFYMLLRLLRFFAAKKNKPVRKSRSPLQQFRREENGDRPALKSAQDAKAAEGAGC
jgi:hypothetical protein